MEHPSARSKPQKKKDKFIDNCNVAELFICMLDDSTTSYKTKSLWLSKQHLF